MTNKRTIQISLPSTGEDEWQALRDPVMSGWLTQGPKVAEFEKAFANEHNVKSALAVTSCTTGLHLVLASMNLCPGDEVIIPAFTWIATANVVMYCGATPVFVDVDPATFNIDAKQIKSKITEKTKAIIVVHLFGLCADMDAIKSELPQHVKIIEDAACAAGALYKNQSAGSLSQAGVFSFHPRKSITTGEGGMITTNDAEFAEHLNQMRNHGASISEEQRHNGAKPYLLPDFNLLGFNYRMTDMQGAIGLVQLKKLNQFIDERAHWANYYREQLSKIDWLKLPEEPENGRHAWQAFVTYVNPDKAPMPRNDLMEILQQNGISTRPGTHAVHMQNYYAKMFNIKDTDFPNARNCQNNSLAIPLHNRMVEADYKYVCDEIKRLDKND